MTATNPFYQDTGNPPAQTRGISSSVRSEFALIQAGFDGVNAQTGTTLPASIASKGAIAGQAWTGTHDFSGAVEVLVPTPTKINDAVTKSYADGLSFSTALPSQAGNAGLFVTTNGTTASWAAPLPTQAGNTNKILTTNGTAVSWTSPGISTINATITSSTTLVGAYLYVPVAMTAIGQSVTLPAANTLQLGGAQYIIRNTGTLVFNVRDNSGTLIASVPVRGELLLMLSANTTATGAWAVGNLSEFEFLNQYTISSASVISNAPTATLFNCYALTATTYLIVYNLSSNMYGTVATVSGSSISFSTATHINTGASQFQSICQLPGSNTFIGAGSNSSNGYFCSFTVSGTTIIFGAAYLIGTVNQANMAISAMSSTQVIATYLDGSNNVCAVSATVSGTALTIGTSVEVAATNTSGANASCVALNSNTVLVTYIASGGFAGAAILSLSGTVITVNTPVTSSISTIGSAYQGNVPVLLGSGNVMVVYSTIVVVISISGTVPTFNTPTTVGVNFINVIWTSSSGGFFLYTNSSASVTALPFSLSGTMVILGTALTGVLTVTTPFYVAAANYNNAAQMLVMYLGTSTFINTVILEFVK